MAENSKIEWTDHTFNPWTGCTKVSPGCANCYAEGWAKRSGLVEWGPKGERRRTSPANWRHPEKWDREAAASGRRAKVFCASLADVFEDHPSIDPQWREDLFELIARTPNLDWLLLTKRPDRMRAYFDGAHHCGTHWLAGSPAQWPLPNVWLGTTVESQHQAEERIPHLLAAPAAVRFLSCEPLLGPVDLSAIIDPPPTEGARLDALRGRLHQEGFNEPFSGPRLNWVIAGGESGPKARPMHPDWARSLRDQCAAAGVPFFFKQWGEWRWGGRTSGGWYFYPSQTVQTLQVQDGDGSLFTPNRPDHDFGDGNVAIRVGKKAAGHLLDGREHNEAPHV